MDQILMVILSILMKQCHEIAPMQILKNILRKPQCPYKIQMYVAPTLKKLRWVIPKKMQFMKHNVACIVNINLVSVDVL